MNTVPVVARSVGSSVASADVAIIGDGSRSLALGSMLSMAGHNIRVWSPDGIVPGQCEVRRREHETNHVKGATGFLAVSDDPAAILPNSTIVIVSCPATRYGAMVDLLAPHMRDDQLMVLSHAPLGAALEFARRLGRARPLLKTAILETGALFDSAGMESEVMVVNGPRRQVSICGRSRNETRRGLAQLRNIWSGLVPASNVLERGLTDFERILRPIVRVFQAVNLHPPGDENDLHVISPGLISIIKSVEAEVSGIARGFGLGIPKLNRLLVDYCGAKGTTLPEQLTSLGPLFCHEQSPLESATLKQLGLEIGETVVLLEAFARLAHVRVPLLDAVTQIGSVVTGRDLPKQGRSLEDLGLLGFDVHEIVEAVNT